MKISILLIAAIGICAAAAQGKGDPEGHQQGSIAKLLDEHLNRVYESVLGAATPEHRRDARDAQRAWLKYRDAEVKAVDKRLREGTEDSDSIREDDRKFRHQQLTFARIEELSRQLRYAQEDYAPEKYVGEYGIMIDELGVSLVVKGEGDAFKAEAHRGIDGKSGSHFSIHGIARITAPHVLTISGDPREAAKALMLGKQCILYWENYRFYLLSR
jgi:uncharacterized protein YecT (DUF1311 family)